jgi:hypothetical protein
MGNCAGIFSNCKGDDNSVAGAQDGVIKKIDREQMNKALAANQEIGSFGRGVKGSNYPQQWGQNDSDKIQSH